MSVNLQKGQKVDLTKGNSGLKRIMVGLGWDEAQQKGFSLFGSRSKPIDCDASVFMINQEDGKLKGVDDIVYFGNLSHKSTSVIHMGDNMTGDGDGDDEQILVDLKKVPANYNKIVFVVNIYQARERKQHFGLIKNAFIRVVDADNNKEILKYNLSENYDDMTAMIFGEIYLHEGEWKFNAIGQPTQDNSIKDLAKKYS